VEIEMSLNFMKITKNQPSSKIQIMLRIVMERNKAKMPRIFRLSIPVNSSNVSFLFLSHTTYNHWDFIRNVVKEEVTRMKIEFTLTTVDRQHKNVNSKKNKGENIGHQRRIFLRFLLSRFDEFA
jgi:hypothetical protein